MTNQDQHQYRIARRSGSPDRASASDRRTPFQRDRDRILYSDYFRRLASVTQVASSLEGGIFHNRLTHSIKVAQVARRLSELLLDRHPELNSKLNPDVVEAAALAHDLGHPPFGHVADEQLCKLAEENGLEDGFEGNAQTFRIVTRLSIRRSDAAALGLDLTRATMAAIAKYPWSRSRGANPDIKKRKKFSFYDDDADAAKVAVLDAVPTGSKTLECQIMDLADSITYSVHDLEDFFRAGLVPVERIVRSEAYRIAFLARWKKAMPDDLNQRHFQDVHNFGDVKNLLSSFLTYEAEPGTQEEAELLDIFRSLAISKFVGAVQVTDASGNAPNVTLAEPYNYQTKFLQRLIWDYVILNPRLATQQAGQIRIIEELFQFFLDALGKQRIDRLPTRFQGGAARVCQPNEPKNAQSRFAIDIVATLTEAEAISLYGRVNGHRGGSVMDLIY